MSRLHSIERGGKWHIIYPINLCVYIPPLLLMLRLILYFYSSLLELGFSLMYNVDVTVLLLQIDSWMLMPLAVINTIMVCVTQEKNLEVDARKAGAFNETDRKMIFEIIENDVDGGFDSLDENIKHKIGKNLRRVSQGFTMRLIFTLVLVCILCMTVPVLFTLYRAWSLRKISFHDMGQFLNEEHCWCTETCDSTCTIGGEGDEQWTCDELNLLTGVSCETLEQNFGCKCGGCSCLIDDGDPVCESNPDFDAKDAGVSLSDIVSVGNATRRLDENRPTSKTSLSKFNDEVAHFRDGWNMDIANHRDSFDFGHALGRSIEDYTINGSSTTTAAIYTNSSTTTSTTTATSSCVDQDDIVGLIATDLVDSAGLTSDIFESVVLEFNYDCSSLILLADLIFLFTGIQPSCSSEMMLFDAFESSGLDICAYDLGGYDGGFHLKDLCCFTCSKHDPSAVVENGVSLNEYCGVVAGNCSDFGPGEKLEGQCDTLGACLECCECCEECGLDITNNCFAERLESFDVGDSIIEDLPCDASSTLCGSTLQFLLVSNLLIFITTFGVLYFVLISCRFLFTNSPLMKTISPYLFILVVVFTSLASITCTVVLATSGWFFAGDGGLMSFKHVQCSEDVTDVPVVTKSVPEFAFYSCSMLKEVDMQGANVKQISTGAFYGCSSLQNIQIPSSVTIIEEFAFSGCSSMTSVDFSNADSLLSISAYAFRGCTKLTSITLPDSLTSIEEAAFSGCIELNYVEISDSVSHIGKDAFESCDSIETMIIGNSVTSIDNLLFATYCNALSSIHIGNSVPIIPDGAFEGCNNIVNVEMGISVVSIGSDAFSRCSNMTRFIGGESDWPSEFD